MKRKLYFSVAKKRKFTPIDCVKYYFPEKSDKEADYILWEKTCFPFDTDMYLTQLYNLYLKRKDKKDEN